MLAVAVVLLTVGCNHMEPIFTTPCGVEVVEFPEGLGWDLQTVAQVEFDAIEGWQKVTGDNRFQNACEAIRGTQVHVLDATTLLEGRARRGMSYCLDRSVWLIAHSRTNWRTS